MSKPQPNNRKDLKRPRGLLASRKAATVPEDPGPIVKRIRTSDSTVDVDQDTLNTQDWSDLKELFENALDAFYGETPAAALPLIRGVLHECARLVNVHKDPAKIYSPLEREESASAGEPASAFYTIYASAWFLMSTFARTDATLLDDGEPKAPISYVMSTLAACEEGQTALDLRKEERSWDLELVKGRAHVAVAQSEIELRENTQFSVISQSSSIPAPAQHANTNISTSFQRGVDCLTYAIEHYPKERPREKTEEDKTLQDERFARALLDAAQNVLIVADDLHQESSGSDTDDRVPDTRHLASAQDFFSTLTRIPNIPPEVRVQAAFGEAQAVLAVGAALAEEVHRRDADAESDKGLREEAAKILTKAVELFDKLRGLLSKNTKKSYVDENELKPLIQEALVTLATMLPEGVEQEAMYARYRQEGGSLEDDEDDDEGDEDDEDDGDENSDNEP